MADFLAVGNKKHRCKCGHINVIPFLTTVYKCQSCGMTTCAFFRGVVIDKHGNYIY